MNTTGSPFVSVVLNVYNRIEEVRETLSELRKSSYPAMEVIVVDDCSTNDVADIISREFPEVQLIRLPRNYGPIVSRNFGMASAIGQYIVVLDDDSFPGHQCIDKMVHEFEHDETLGIIAFRVEEYRSDKVIDDARQDEDHRLVTEPGIFMGCGVGIRRKVIDRIGYWEEWFSGPFECAFSVKAMTAGFSLKRFSDIFVFHKAAMGFRPTMRRNVEGAKNLFYYYWKYYPAQAAAINTTKLLFHCSYLSLERKSLVYLIAVLQAFSNLYSILQERDPFPTKLLKRVFHPTIKSIGLCL